LLYPAYSQLQWQFAKDARFWVSTEMGSHVGNLKELHAAGLLTAEHAVNHCFGLSGEDRSLIQDAGVPVNVCTIRDQFRFRGGRFVLAHTSRAAAAALQRRIGSLMAQRISRQPSLG
jgi:hypothetical protein